MNIDVTIFQLFYGLHMTLYRIILNITKMQNHSISVVFI